MGIKNFLGVHKGNGWGWVFGIGMLSILSSFNPEGGGSNLFIGIAMVVGAAAYRSATKRKQGEFKSSALRIAFEGVLLLVLGGQLFALLAGAFINGGSDGVERLFVEHLFILLFPAFAIAAYFFVFFGNKEVRA